MAAKPIFTGSLADLLDEGECGAAVIGRGERRGAELAFVGRRINILRADRAGEYQRHAGALGLGHDRRVGRGQARVEQQHDIVLGQQLLGVRGSLRRLRRVILDDEVDLLAVDSARGVDPVDIDAKRIDSGCIGAGRRPGERGGDPDHIGILRQCRAECSGR